MQEKRIVLVVEDQTVNRQLLKKELEKSFQVILAENGKDALDILSKRPDIDAILLDLIMPEMDGYEFMHKIKSQNYRDCPIIVMTGDATQKTESQALKAGAWDFVAKPYKPAIMIQRINMAIDRSELAILEEMRYRDSFDSMTGLYNKNGFFTVVEALFEENPEDAYVIYRIDINRFSLINSFYGVEEGDRILIYMAESIRQQHIDGIIGRIDADEFVVCVKYTGQEDCKHFIKQLSRMVAQYKLNFHIVLNFGIYVVEDIHQPIFQMLDYARMAAKSVKGNYVHNYAYYDQKMEQSLMMDQTITNEMEEALENEEFLVYLQPKYDIKNHVISGAEALVRWDSPTHGMISPGKFIPTFEKNGFISKLDYYMWEHVCILLKKWLDEGKNPDPVSVNVSRVSMFNPNIVENIEDLVGKYGIPVELFNLEITESVYMADPELMKQVAKRLRDRGFLIFMDDFGSEYSSLNTLKDIELDILKVDMKFLPTGKTNTKSEKILASIIRMAGWIGMPVVVEGVETKDQLDFLQEIGCGYVQGFYFAKPMPVAEYEGIMTTKEKLDWNVVAQNGPRKLDVAWSTNEEFVTLMKSIAIPFVIFEKSGAHLEIIRSNEAFRRAFNYEEYSYGFESIYMNPGNYQRMLQTIDLAIRNKGGGECECNYRFPDGKRACFYIKFSYIDSTESGAVLCGVYSDISQQKMLEGVLDKLFSMMNRTRSRKPAMLIVDDQEISRDMLRSMFEGKYDIFEALDGQQALDVLEERKTEIEVILLDLVMPKMNGPEFLKIKNQNSELLSIPVIIVSSEDSNELQLRMLEYGVNDYVTKPFIPEVVARRVNNVIEYNSRFQELLKEYKETNILESEKEEFPQVFNVKEIKNFMHYLNEIFDVVRLVKPETTAVLDIQPEGVLSEEAYSCFKVWEKDIRCENCTSMNAANHACQLSKYEFVENNIFYVVSKPLKIIDSKGGITQCILEIVSHISDRILGTDPDSNRKIRDLLDVTQKKVYTDALTGVFNRRYWNEMLFLHHGNKKLAEKVAVIMVDLTHFKDVNDSYGHLVGDEILVKVAEKMTSQVRRNDSVIRYGGDEFLVILTNCEEPHVVAAVERIRHAISEVTYGENRECHAGAALGYAYTAEFKASEEMMQEMLDQADHAMYEEKVNRKE